MITGKRVHTLAAELSGRKHKLLSGVSEGLGGNDESLSPHELLEAALAACTVITVQMYANRKQWKLDSTDVAVHIESESKEATKIIREINFRGDLSDDQRIRLLEIANKCPIHNLLESKIEIETKLIARQ